MAHLPGGIQSGGTDAFVRVYDANGIGNVVAAVRHLVERRHLRSLAVDASGVYVTGYTYGTLPGQVTRGSARCIPAQVRSEGYRALDAPVRARGQRNGVRHRGGWHQGST